MDADQFYAVAGLVMVVTVVSAFIFIAVCYNLLTLKVVKTKRP